MDEHTKGLVEIYNAVKHIFAKALSIENDLIDLKDSFFELGGDSLRLTNLPQVIKNEFNILIDIRLLFKYNSVENLGKLIDFYKRHPILCVHNVKYIKASKLINLSFEQQQIWIAHNVSNNKSLYNIPFILEISTSLDVHRLCKALEKISLEEELFKCGIDIKNNIPMLKCHEYVPFNYEQLDISEELVENEINLIINQDFNLQIAPLYRFRLLKTPNRYILCCVFHHIIVDSPSLSIFCKLVSSYYKNIPIKTKMHSYTDYISYQNNILSNRKTKHLESYWKSHCITDDHIVQFKKRNLLNKIENNMNHSKIFCLDNDLLKRVKLLSEKNSVSLFTNTFSIFSIVIYHLISQAKFYISLPVSTRINSDFSDTFGLFINLLPYQCSVDSSNSFIQHLDKMSGALTEFYRNCYIQHNVLQELSMIKREDFSKIFNVMFTLDYEKKLDLDSVTTKVITTPYIEHKFDISFFLCIGERSSVVTIEYNPSKFSVNLIENIYSTFCYATKHVLNNPNQLICDIPITRCSNIQTLDNNNYTNKCITILHLLDEVVSKYPEKIAVEDSTHSITFFELDSKSNQFANYLRGLQHNAGDIVAIYMKHSIELIICVLGILKARCVYVPIHPSLPNERINFIINQVDIKSIITDLYGLDTSIQKNIISTSYFFNNLNSYSNKHGIQTTIDDLAYIIFTSGTTGYPKGVIINHENLINLFSQVNLLLNCDSNDTWVLFHSYAFDFSVWEIFGSLLQGAKLIIPDDIYIRSPEYLYRLILDKKITILNQTPSAFNAFALEAVKYAHKQPLPLRYIILGGEAINNQSILNWFKCYSSHQPKLLNMYGITEGTIHVTYQFLNECCIKNNEYGSLIGKPLENNSILLLNEHGVEVPVGFVGEMYISGKCVSQGYINNPDLSAQRFVKIAKYPHEMFYRTGDLAIRNADNTFSYISRNDTQFKIRGYRVELNEIGSFLLRSGYISDVAIYFDKKDDFNQNIIAFVVPNYNKIKSFLEIDNYCEYESNSILIKRTREYIHSVLPDYMQPSLYEIVKFIPKTVNGKIDYDRLKDKSTFSKSVGDYKSQPDSNSDIKQLIKSTWQEILNIQLNTTDSNFFEIGGNSILAIRIAMILSEKLNFEVSVIDIFKYPTIDKFSDNLMRKLSIKSIDSEVNFSRTELNDSIAIIGIEGRFPQASNISEFWSNLLLGKECLISHKISQNKDDFFIPIAGIIENPYEFDADHFKITPFEAKFMDPQHRLLLEVCYLNLLNANINLHQGDEKVGVFASIDQSTYIQLIDTHELSLQDKRVLNYSNSRDFVATRIAYKLGLTGPAITLNTACSSSLTACVQAANSLLRHECDIAIVCASSLILQEIQHGYFYEPDGIMSSDGKCCPFDQHSSGTVPGSAVVSIVLKRYTDALNSNANIIAIIDSYSINNDGNDKVGYAAPSVSGQKKCLENIYKDISSKIENLDFIETHGTGTKIGDAVEITALSEVFSDYKKNKINIGSVKANIGHTSAAAGLCGLIKAALILNKKEIPPQINFTQWNDLCAKGNNIFQVNTKSVKLRSGIRYAGISSFGIGGTNVHMLLRSTDKANAIEHKFSYNDIFKNRKKYIFIKGKNYIEKINNNGLNCKSSNLFKQVNSKYFDKINHLDFIKEFLDLIANDLGVNSVKLENNFFDLGGDSIIALGILAKVLKMYNVSISIDDFYNSKNIEQLVVRIFRNSKYNSPRLNTLQNKEGKTLILIHSGCGSVYHYDIFKKLRNHKLKILTIENQVLNDIDSDINSISTMADHYISMLEKSIYEKDYLLAGWSFGGIVAYEMAYQLYKKGFPPKQIIMLDSWAKYPDKFNEFNMFKNTYYSKLDQSYIFEDDMWIKMLWKRLKMLISYQPPQSNLRVKLYKAIVVDSDHIIADNDSNFWADYTNNLNIINVNATHQNILNVIQEQNLFCNFLDA